MMNVLLTLLATYFGPSLVDKSTSLVKTSATLMVVDKVMGFSQRLVRSLLLGLTALAFGSVGLFAGVYQIAAQYDTQGFVTMNATLASSIVFLLVGIGLGVAIAVDLKKVDVKTDVPALTPSPTHSAGGDIQHVLMSALHGFADGFREGKVDQRTQSQLQQSRQPNYRSVPEQSGTATTGVYNTQESQELH